MPERNFYHFHCYLKPNWLFRSTSASSTTKRCNLSFTRLLWPDVIFQTLKVFCILLEIWRFVWNIFMAHCSRIPWKAVRVIIPSGMRLHCYFILVSRFIFHFTYNWNLPTFFFFWSAIKIFPLRIWNNLVGLWLFFFSLSPLGFTIL